MGGSHSGRDREQGKGCWTPPPPQDQGRPHLTLTPHGRSLLLPAGDLCEKDFPRVAAAHLRPSRVRARLPSPVSVAGLWWRGGSGVSPAGPHAHQACPTQGELQRVLPAVPRHALGRRHLLPRRCRAARGARSEGGAGPRVAGARAHRTAAALAGAAALCGLFYLFARFRYFQGYARSAQLR